MRDDARRREVWHNCASWTPMPVQWTPMPVQEGGARDGARPREVWHDCASWTPTPVQEGGARDDARLHHQRIDGPVTIVMKNIPARATHQDLVEAVQASGFRGRFDYMHVPMKGNGVQNKGYSFVSFCNYAEAASFRAVMDGARVRESSGKCVSFEVASAHRPLEELASSPQLVHETRWGPIVFALKTAYQIGHDTMLLF